jgi:endogenous inhibitor of DNA gyrase (YacG/DUF329 family)
VTCPICGKATDAKMRPFCSKRCADVDLARWFTGSYAVPSNDPEDAEALEDALLEAERHTKPERPH